MHVQNAHHTGFLQITRVVADVWTRLSRKDHRLALRYLDRWRHSPYRLIRRLALFVCADPVVPAIVAADVLIDLPLGELFLTNSAVEVFRLLTSRWNELPPTKREQIEDRLSDGPPREWLSEGIHGEEYADRLRFDILGQLEKHGFQLNAKSNATLSAIRARRPQWVLRPEEQTGFHVWLSSSGYGEEKNDPGNLQGIDDEQLVGEAMRLDAAADFGDGSELCRVEPDRALRGLEAEANFGRYPEKAWHQFLWAQAKFEATSAILRIAKLLIAWPENGFGIIAGSASFWLQENARTIDDADFWQAWDKIFAAVCGDAVEYDDDDPLTSALNVPAGRLAGIILRRMSGHPGDFPLPTQERLEKLLATQGNFGKLARVSLAGGIAFLFYVAPEWTAKHLVPLFEWSSADAAAMWSARRFHGNIGSPELVRLIKVPLLELFSRTDVPPDELRVYGEWLAVIALINQTRDAKYPLTMTEIRAALRRAAEQTLPSVGHRLAQEMESAKTEEEISRWRDVVGPVFRRIWPLDVELQTSASTFKLVQILEACGEAFSEAVETILPFIQPELRNSHLTVFSLSQADDILYSSAPEKMLDLLSALVGRPPLRSIYALGNALERIRVSDPQLANTALYQRLASYAAPSG